MVSGRTKIQQGRWLSESLTMVRGQKVVEELGDKRASKFLFIFSLISPFSEE
ncbi:hypothetical protein KFK09_008054 [Dendrobium nobile]|uniref:Uncharacterized protein n=1 Tax=Dendrobium nobile TaxID=94219 RepID=A0A8T3BTG7_DENNO|nr:hypothetical protein KFK09_008054 [Dendrobium nobile]